MKRTLLLFVGLTLLSPPQAAAQDVPVVFVHGFIGDQNTWASAATRLQHQLAIRPYLPRLPWREPFEAQAGELHRQFGSLPSTTIAVGHSNGGLVSRQWSTHRSLGGLLTVGTPNHGAPIVDHLHDVLKFNEALYNTIGFAGGAFGVDPATWNYVYLFVQGALFFGQQIAVDTVWGVLGLGLQAAVPVTGQMSPGSYIIGSLNSPANVAREAAAVRNRAALLYVAHNYAYGGPMRAIDPDNADRFYANMWWSIGILETAAAGLATYYPHNANAMWIAHALFSAAGVVRQVDPMWCWLVTNDRSCATWHDGIVPFDHQRLPSAANIGIGGPAHLQEAKESGPIHFALVNYLGVAGRSGSTGSGGSGGVDQLTPGQTLYSGQSRRSADDRFELVFQGDGNLVLYRRSDGVPLWASHTQAGDGEAAMQGDGNFVIYDRSGAPRWHTATHNFPGASLTVQGDGNVVIYDYYGFPIWATGTAQ